MSQASTIAVVLLCLMSSLCHSDRLQAADWTEFRGPTGQGLSDETSLPVHWSATENVAWSREIEGKGWSSPILLGDRLYLTTAVSQGTDAKVAQSLRALCVDAATGDPLWDRELFSQPEGAPIHGKNSHASPTPLTDGKRLYVHFGPHGTAALDLAGNVLWRNTELKYSPVHGNGGSPALVDGLLAISCDGSDVQYVVGLDAETGAIRWKTPRSTKPSKGFSFGTPLVIDLEGERQIISPASDAVIAYAPADGRELWKVVYPGGYSVVPRPVFGQGLVFVCTGYNTPQVLAIRPQGARGDVTETHVAWKATKGGPHNPSPILVGEQLYLVSDKGVASCLDARTGKELWQQRLGGNYSASPVFAEGRIYISSEEGETVVLAADPERYRELARSGLGERMLASFALGDSAVFARTESHLWRIGAANAKTATSP